MSTLKAFAWDSPAGRLAVQGGGVVLATLLAMYVLSGREQHLLLAALAGLFSLLIFRYPHVGVLAIFALWFLRISPALLGSRYLQLTYIFGALLVVPLAFRLLHDREVWVWRVPQVKHLMAIGALFAVSTLWAAYKFPVTFFPELDRTAVYTQDFLTRLVFLVFFLYFINTRRKLDLVVWLVVGLVVLTAVDAYVKLGTISGMRRLNASFGIGQSPTVFPYVILFGASLLWCYYAFSRTTRWKGWLPPLLVGLPIAVLASGSRTSLLQLLTFGTLVFVDRSSQWSKTQRIRGLVLLACVLLLMSVIVPTVAVMRSTNFEATAGTPGAQSLKDRINTMSNGLEISLSNPVLGVGLGNFLWIHTAYYGLKRLPHNSYLWALAEGGIAVLALYLLLWYATWRMLRQLETAGPLDMQWLAKAFRFNLVLLLVYSLSDDTFLQILPYLLLGATVAMYRLWLAQPQPGAPAHEPARMAGRPVGARR
jgi:hypothetical protein